MARTIPCRKSSRPLDVVDYLVGDWVVEEAVDGEVAPLGVLLGVAKLDRCGPAPVDVIEILAEGGDFDETLLLGADDGDDAEGGADGDRSFLTEQLTHIGRPGVRGDVVVLRRQPQHLIPHATAGPEGFVARDAQFLHDL